MIRTSSHNASILNGMALELRQRLLRAVLPVLIIGLELHVVRREVVVGLAPWVFARRRNKQEREDARRAGQRHHPPSLCWRAAQHVF